MKRTIMLCCFSTLIALLGCKNKKNNKESVVKYMATSPIIADTTIVKQYVCQIRAIRHIEIRSQERGYLEKIFVDEGQFVHKGQVLFQIMPNIYNAELLKAKAEVAASEIEVQNTQALSDKNIVSPNELALTKAKLDKAKAEMALARTHLQFTRIVAPYDGFIDHLQLKLGSLVDEGALITTLSDNSQMWVYFNVPEAEYLDYSTNDSAKQSNIVQLLMANNQVFNQQGRVETIEADFNNETGNIAFRATFPNPKNLLRNGETGNILMQVPFRKAIIIPQKATFEIMDKKYVYTIDANNTVHLTRVSIVAEMPDLFIVNSGLKGQEKILLEGVRKVQDNDKIQFQYQDPRKVMSTLTLPSE